VGLVPIAAAGLDARAVCAGADAMRARCEEPALRRNPAYLLAGLHHLFDTKKGRNIHVLFPYADALRDVGDWYVQLWAESLGKNERTGPTPIRAVGATDQHSMLQLLMEGPQDKLVTFVAVETPAADLVLPAAWTGQDALAYLGGKRMSQLAGTAIGIDRHRVGEHDADLEAGGRHFVGTGDHLGEAERRNRRRVGGEIGAGIGEAARTIGEDAALGVERELALAHMRAGMGVAKECFRTLAGPVHGAAELARGPQHQRLLRIGLELHAEAAADIRRQHAEPVRRELAALLTPGGAVSRETVGVASLSDSETAPEPVEIPVRYDGADLAHVAELLGTTVPAVIEAHTGTVWRCGFVGFAPGFGYLEAPDGRLAVPRRDRARTAIPAGAVALAGGYSAVYPRSTPGGWQLIGHTDAVLWDVDRDPPALIRAGSAVRFVAVDR